MAKINIEHAHQEGFLFQGRTRSLPHNWIDLVIQFIFLMNNSSSALLEGSSNCSCWPRQAAPNNNEPNIGRQRLCPSRRAGNQKWFLHIYIIQNCESRQDMLKKYKERVQDWGFPNLQESFDDLLKIYYQKLLISQKLHVNEYSSFHSNLGPIFLLIVPLHVNGNMH